MLIIYCMVGVVVLGIVISIIRTVDWYNVFYKRYGNDPNKAKVYVDFGDNELFYDGWFVFNDEKFYYYAYDIGHRHYTAIVPAGWKEVFIRGRRKISVDFGIEMAKPLITDDRIPALMGAELLNKSMQKYLAVAMVNSLESRKGIKIGIFVLIIVVVIGGFLIYRNMNKSEPVTPPAVTQNQTQPQTQKTIEQQLKEPGLTDQQIRELMNGGK